MKRAAPIFPALGVACLAFLVLVAGCATVEPQPVEPGAVKRATFRDTTRSLGFFYYIDPGCASREQPKIRVVRSPAHGTLSVAHGEGFPNFPKSNVRIECNKQRLPGTYVRYRSYDRFTGRDVAEIEILYPTGTVGRVIYTIEVLDIPLKVSDAKPRYPEAARRANIEGDVVAWVYVDANGDVTRVAIITSPNDLFSDEVKSVLGRWKFGASSGDKTAFPFIGEYRITFRLKDYVPGVEGK
jgi:TonB family protein